MSGGDTLMMEDDPHDAPAMLAPDPGAAAPGDAGAALARGLLGLLEVFDRSGATVTRLRVTHWPVAVGRALSADLVLDDGHVAAEHLRIEQSPSGTIQVCVLDTFNGVRRGGKLYPRGECFDWNGEDDLSLGRSRLRLRLPGMPIAPEQALPKSPWRVVGLTVALMLAVFGLSVLQAWFKVTEPAKFAQAALSLVGVLLGGLVVWAGLWSLATKLFTGHPQFWRHVRIACAFSLLQPLATGGGYLLAFAFSWESLARFNFLLSIPVLAAGVIMHLLVIAPQRRRSLVAMVAGVALLGVVAMMGANWLQNKRASNQLYLSALFPPGWRLAPTVPLDQFMREAASIRQRLDERLKDHDEDAPGDDEED
ncbi:MAG: FHA domain-containing protein [Rhodoferax sp.]|nr:FHA domain-containing protein [Rhodoferax sp.]